MWRPSSLMSSLRARLAGSMLAVFVLALATAASLDRLVDFSTATPGGEAAQDAVVLALFSAVVIGLVWVVSLWSLRPLARAAEEAGRAGPAHPGARISPARLPAEIHPLVASVNAALDRMEQAYDAERRFTANAAHELRTPLSVLSLRVQQARDTGTADWPGISDDVRQMTRLVNQLLDLARKEQAGRAPAALSLVNVSRIAREAAAAALPLMEAAGRSLMVDLPDDLPVRGRPDDLRDMVLNLLDNAAKHGAGSVALTGGVEGHLCVLRVADEGPGVPPDLREAVFERFAKAAASSSGSGLGLAIVREVARGHGGDVVIEDGAGCRVRVVLPRAS